MTRKTSRVPSTERRPQILRAATELFARQGVRSVVGFDKSAEMIAEAKRRAAELVGMALDALSGFDEKADPLREIARYIVYRKS